MYATEEPAGQAERRSAHFAAIYKLDSGRIARMDLFADPRQALEPAGLSE